MPPRHTLTEQERTVLDIIMENPFASQKDLAERCGMTRPTLATYIGQLTRKGYLLGRAYVAATRASIVCIGGAAIDRKFCLSSPLVTGTSNPATGYTGFGGVARNVCENLARLGQETTLITIVGDDLPGHALADHMKNCGVNTSRIQFAGNASTAEYIAILDDSHDLGIAVFDAAVFDRLDIDTIQRSWPLIAAAGWLFVDCNVSAEVLAWLAQKTREAGFSLAVDTVSVPKAERLRGQLGGVRVLFTNRDEALTLLEGSTATTSAAIAMALVAQGVETVIMTEGARGLTVADASGVRALPAYRTNVVDVTGAGDALVAATLSALSENTDTVRACRQGLAAAALTVGCRESVCPGISHEQISTFMKTHAGTDSQAKETAL
ncbi:sugar kinase [Komagataeibacter rhaeticus]|nr:carbohydrate kinase [Komagataeibacter rhaeticus]ATU73012.1 sugar kinase [Komagataeibacter xylinus]EGG77189.1 Putative sugar kinase yeiI [Gluconacetobacter sp. SXCC-1]PYD54234.1 sugar kinase [Komagataeibacter rhaeticus]WPP22827.1 carbohydrate kinase [Komagataeibacter rhaeticus]SAY48445.1 Pseudouridine kinase [Komagataeibacter rhaeticus]